METIKIEAYGLADYTNQVIKAAKEGFVVSEDNDKYPYNYTGFFFAILVKEDGSDEEIATIVAPKNPTGSASKGRPKKVAEDLAA